jgi:biopolymer transport protein ExbD
MATIQVGGGGHGKRAVDHEIPLIPFIDLLLCCVMFLLVTAVWNRLSQISTPLEAPGNPSAMAAPDDGPTLFLRLTSTGFELGSTLGDHTDIARDEGLVSLREALTERRAHELSSVEMAVLADDGVSYAGVIEALDTLAATGFEHVAVRDRM